MKFNGAPKASERPVSAQEQFEEAELRIQKLIGEINANAELLNDSKIQELAKTAEGQAKLLKLANKAKELYREFLAYAAAFASVSGLGSLVADSLAQNSAAHDFFAAGSKGTAFLALATAIIGGLVSAFRASRIEKQITDELGKGE